MNTSCKILVYYPENFRIIPGTLMGTEPMRAKLSGITEEELGSPACIKIRWYVGNTPHISRVKITSVQDDEYTFETVSERTSESEDRHFIEFRAYFEMISVAAERMSDFYHRVDRINGRYRSTLSNQIKKIITDEDLTNQYLFKLLIQIDSKLDELLDTLKDEDKLDGLSEIKLFSLGGGGFTFQCGGGNLAKGDKIYLQSLPKNGAGINFAAVCSISDVIETGDKSICEAVFEYIDENTRESIIHHIFQKERELLKRKRN